MTTKCVSSLQTTLSLKPMHLVIARLVSMPMHMARAERPIAQSLQRIPMEKQTHAQLNFKRTCRSHALSSQLRRTFRMQTTFSGFGVMTNTASTSSKARENGKRRRLDLEFTIEMKVPGQRLSPEMKYLFHPDIKNHQIEVPPDKDFIVHVTAEGFREWDESIGGHKVVRVPSGTETALEAQLEHE